MSKIPFVSLIIASCGTLACQQLDDALLLDLYQTRASTASLSALPDWSYTGATGPEFWGELSEEFALCSEGQEQSPVDFPFQLKPRILENNEYDYASSSGVWENDGHTIVVHFAGESGSTGEPNVLLLEGEPYELLQFHFHARSEHQVDGTSYPLEMHLVHRSAGGELAVVGVFFDEGPENRALREVFEEMSASETGPRLLSEDVDLPALLPPSRRGWAYAGSLTTPPCSEGVRWSVYTQRLRASAAQIAAFSALYEPSNRPVQGNVDIQAQLEAL